MPRSPEQWPPGRRPRRPPEEELGLSLAKLAGAKVTLLVGGKPAEKPRLRLEIELASGQAVLRPLPAEFYHEESGSLRLGDLADWLHMDLAAATDAVRAIYPEYAEWVDRAGLARKLAVDVDAPLSALPLRVRPEQERWVVKAHRDLPGTPRVPLGTIQLAGEEKVAVTPMPASPISVDDSTSEAGEVAVGPGEVGAAARRSCLPWVVGLVVVLGIGIIGFLVLREPGSQDAGTAATPAPSPASPAATAATAPAGDGTLAVAEYADTSCEIFAATLQGPDSRFREALGAASGATQDLPELYGELAAAASEFADALDATSQALADVPPPDVDGGAGAHAAAIEDYADAATAVRGIATATASFDPATADQQDADALGASINGGLTDLDAALTPDSTTPEIDEAFEQSQACARP